MVMSFDTVHVYAQSAALSVEGVQLENRSGYVVRLEAARRISDSKNYDWASKIALQVTLREFPDVMACLLGHLDAVEFEYHGEQKNKGYRIVKNPDNAGLLFELFSAKDGRVRVPALPSDQFSVSVLALRYFQRNYGGLNTESLLKLMANSYTVNTN